VDQVLLRNLWLVSLAVAALYLMATVVLLLRAAEYRSPSNLGSVLAALAVSGGLAAWLRFRPPPAHYAPLLLFLLSSVAVLREMVRLRTEQDGTQDVVFTAILAASAILYLSTRWYLVFAAGTVAGWVLLDTTLLSNVQPNYPLIIGMAGISIVINMVRVRNLWEVIEARLAAERQQQELSAALAAVDTSETRYVDFLENSNNIVHMIDASNRFVFVNQAWQEALGYSFDEARGLNIRDIVAPASLAELERVYQLLVDGLVDIKTSFTLVGKHGREVVVEGSVGGQYEDGKLVLRMGIYQDVTEQRRAQEALARHARFEELVTAISTQFINIPSGEVDERINEALKLVAEYAGVERAHVTMIDQAAGGDGLAVTVTHEWCVPAMTPRIGQTFLLPPAERNWWFQRLSEGRPIIIPDTTSESQPLERLDSTDGLRSLAGFPLRIKGVIRGSFSFCTYSYQRDWSDETVRLLEMVSEVLVNALERREQEREIARRREFEELVTTISAQFINVDPDVIDSRIIETLCLAANYNGVDSAFIYSAERDEHTGSTVLTRTHQWCMPGSPCRIDAEITLPPDVAVWWRQYVTEHGVVRIDDFEAFNREHPDSFVAFDGAKSLLIIPLVLDGRTRASLGFAAFAQQQRWSNETLTLLRMVGEVVFSVLERRWRDEENRQHTRFVELITDVSSQFINMSAGAVDEQINASLRLIGTHDGVDRAYLYRVEEDARQAVITHDWFDPAVGPLPAEDRRIILDPEPWYIERLRRLEHVQAERLDGNEFAGLESVDVLLEEGVKSILIIPMQIGGELRGILGLETVRHHHHWSEETVGLLRIVAQVFSDAIERRRSEEQLAQQRDFAVRVLNTMGQGLTITGPNQGFDYANPAFAGMLGLPVTEIIGRPLAKFLHEDDLARFSETWATLRSGQSCSAELRVCCGDGQVRDLLVTAVPNIVNETWTGVISVYSDMTERKRTLQALAEARDHALEASRLKSEFLATVSHEIRTPMNGIIGMTELLLGTQLSLEQRDYGTIVLTQSQELLGILNDILDLSKIESGKFVLDNIPFELEDITTSTIQLLNPNAEAKSLALRAFVDPAIPEGLIGDPARLRQVLVNLVGNAVKFTMEGEIALQVVAQTITDTSVTLRFAVTDTGIGIDQAVLPRLFQPFTQADGSTTRQFGGTGLGLAICRRLVELMGGQIGVESTEGVGSTFWFTAVFAREESSKPLPDGDFGADLSRLRVFVVSNSAQQPIIERYLSAWGMHFQSSDGTEAALAALRRAALDEEPYDVALVDLTNGNHQRFAQLLQSYPELRNVELVLFRDLDAQQLSQDETMGVFSAVLTRPVRPSRLLDTLGTVMNERTQHSLRPQPDVGNEPETVTGALRQGRVILVVEDNPVNQKLALLQLKKLGYVAQAVSNGQEAIDAFSQTASGYGLILMDCHMPEMDGFAATKAIRGLEQHRGKRVPIIAMTANALKGDREKCLAAGMNDYLSKPVTIESLQRMLDHWLPAALLSDEPVTAGHD
jgi:PAS domain S-box-containing protein